MVDNMNLLQTVAPGTSSGSLSLTSTNILSIGAICAIIIFIFLDKSGWLDVLTRRWRGSHSEADTSEQIHTTGSMIPRFIQIDNVVYPIPPNGIRTLKSNKKRGIKTYKFYYTREDGVDDSIEGTSSNITPVMNDDLLDGISILFLYREEGDETPESSVLSEYRDKIDDLTSRVEKLKEENMILTRPLRFQNARRRKTVIRRPSSRFFQEDKEENEDEDYSEEDDDEKE